MVWPFTSWSENGGSKTELDPALQEFVKAQGQMKYSTEQRDTPASSTKPSLPVPSPSTTSTPNIPTDSAAQLAAATPSGRRGPSWGISPNNSRLVKDMPPLLPYDYEPPDPSKLEIKAPDPNQAPDPSKIPTQFKDGRYAHLWKGYRPIAAIEAENKTSAEKLSDVVSQYNDRQHWLKKAAMENCWPEGMACHECNTGPKTAHDRMTMCVDHTRRLERCLRTQARFMRALGYMSHVTDPQTGQEQLQLDEDVQLHADDLYRRMTAQEKMVAEAKEQGKPVPVFAPVMSSEKSRAAGANPVVIGTMTPDGKIHSPTLDDMPDTPENPALPPEAIYAGEKTRRDMVKRLINLDPEMRAIERLALADELRAAQRTAGGYSHWVLRKKDERDERREKGEATITDRISGWLGW